MAPLFVNRSALGATFGPIWECSFRGFALIGGESVAGTERLRIQFKLWLYTVRSYCTFGLSIASRQKKRSSNGNLITFSFCGVSTLPYVFRSLVFFSPLVFLNVREQVQRSLHLLDRTSLQSLSVVIWAPVDEARAVMKERRALRS